MWSEPNWVDCLLKQKQNKITATESNALKEFNRTQSLYNTFRMSRIKSKITLHTKNQEYVGKLSGQSTRDTNSQMTQVLELSDKDFKAVIVTMLQEANKGKCP